MSPLPLLVAIAAVSLLGLASNLASPPPPPCPGGGPLGVGCDRAAGHEGPHEVTRAGRRFAHHDRPPHVEGAAPEARVALRVLLLLALFAAVAAAVAAGRRAAPPDERGAAPSRPRASRGAESR